MSQGRITEAFQPKKRVAHSAKQTKRQQPQPGPAEYHPALPSKPRTVEEEELEILRQFDLNHEFGPCNGITRMERWQRAQRHKLSPPENVLDLIMNHQGNTKYTECVWFSYNI